MPRDVCPRDWYVCRVTDVGLGVAIATLSGKRNGQSAFVKRARRRNILPTSSGLSFSKDSKETEPGEVIKDVLLVVRCLENGAVTHWGTWTDYLSARQEYLDNFSEDACVRDRAVAKNLMKAEER